MSKSKLSRWLMRGAFTLAAVAAVSMLSAEQANAQIYGSSRGVSSGSYGRGGGGFSVSIGNSGLSYGNSNRRSSYSNYSYGGNRGYSAYGGGINRYYRVPVVNYRPSYGGSSRGGTHGSFSSSRSYSPHHYSRSGRGGY